MTARRATSRIVRWRLARIGAVTGDRWGCSVTWISSSPTYAGGGSAAGDLSSFRLMTLDEAVGQLETLDPQATIYAEPRWKLDSRAVIGTPNSRFRRVLYYAENDAFLLES